MKRILLLFFIGITAYSFAQTLDNGFGTNSLIELDVPNTTSEYYYYAVEKDNFYYIAGITGSSSGARIFITKVNKTTGQLDTSFGTNGTVYTDLSFIYQYSKAKNLFITSDNSLLIAGNYNEDLIAVEKRDLNGNLITSFANNGRYTFDVNTINTPSGAYITEHESKYYISGTYIIEVLTQNVSNFVLSLNQNGTINTNFSSNGYKTVQPSNFGLPTDRNTGIVVTNDNKILLSCYSVGEHSFAKFNLNGSLDSSFSGDGKAQFILGTASSASEGIYDMIKSNDGSIWAIGKSFDTGFVNSATLLKLNYLNGTLDTNFSNDGIVKYTNSSNSLGFHSITEENNFFIIATNQDALLAVNKSNGSINQSFGNQGSYSFPLNSFIFRFHIKTSDGLLVLGKNNNNNKAAAYKLKNTSLGIDESISDNEIINLYPNPTTETLNFSKEISNYTIMDISLRVVTNVKNKTNQINVNSLKEGIYIITFEDENGNKQSQKFIKK